LFLPTDGRNAVRATEANDIASDEASSEKKKSLVFNTAMALLGVFRENAYKPNR
jgi:hypothetical protein